MTEKKEQNGIVNLTEEEYHALDGASAHRLMDLLISPAYCYWRMHEAPQETKAKTLGRLVHSAFLQPEIFNGNFAIWKGDRRTKEGKAQYERLVSTGKEVMSEEEFDVLRGCVSALERVFALGVDDKIEASLLFSLEGIRCKSRLDVLRPGNCIIDIKTTSGFAAENSFSYEIKKYKYHLQAAFYLMAARACGVDVDEYYLAVVETKPPHGACMYSLRPEAIEEGGRMVRELLPVWAECVESGIWPGYEGGEIGLPGMGTQAFEEIDFGD